METRAPVLGGHWEEGIMAEALLCQVPQTFRPEAPISPTLFQAQVPVIHEVAPISATTGTATLAVLLGNAAGEMPKLEKKKQGGCEEFERKWEERLEMVKGICGGVPFDAVLFEGLKLCLDEADKVLMQKMREQNKGLKFQDFFMLLRRRYESDSSLQNRRAWETLKLTSVGDTMTLLNWSVFVEKFQLFRNRVEDRSEGEEYRLLMEKLPEKWKRVVLNEESKRKKFKWVVRLTHVPPMSAEQLKVAMEGTLEIGLVKVEASSHGMLVTCGSEIVMQKVMNLSGWSLHGTTVKTAKLEMMMSGDEICEFHHRKIGVGREGKNFLHS